MPHANEGIKKTPSNVEVKAKVSKAQIKKFEKSKKSSSKNGEGNADNQTQKIHIERSLYGDKNALFNDGGEGQIN
eukprot:403351770